MLNQEKEIADLKEQLALAELERSYFRSIADTASQAMVFVGESGSILYANDAFLTIAGLPKDILRSGHTMLQPTIHPEDRTIFEEALERSLSGQAVTGLMRIGSICGQMHTVSFCAMPKSGPDGKLGVHINITDLSAEVLSPYSLTEQSVMTDPLYKWILDKAPIPIYRRSFGAGYEYFNEAFARVFECSAEEVNSKYGTPEQRWLDPAEHDRYISQLLRYREAINFEIQTQPIHGVSKTLLLYAFIDDTYNKVNGFAIDITEQKRLQQTAAENQLRIKSISDNFTQGLIYQVIVMPDGSRKFTYLSQSVTKLHGISVEEGLADARLIYSSVHHEDIAMLLNAENDSLSSLKPFRCEARFLNSDGNVRWSLLTSVPTRLDDGSVSWDGIEFDITDRKLAEIALQQREAQYRFITDNIKDVVWVIDQKTRRFSYISPAIFDQRGFTVEEAMDQTFDQILTPESCEKAFRLIREGVANRSKQAFSTQSIHTEVNELEQYRKDGTIFPVEISTTITFDENNQPQQIIGVTRDISERMHTEHKIKESEARFRSVFENVIDAILIIKDYLFVDCNSHALVVYGCPREEIIGKSPLHFSPETQPSGIASRTLAHRHMDLALTGIPQRFEWVHAHLDGTPFYAEISLTKLDVNGDVFLTAMVRDITEKKNSDLELSRYRTRLEDLVIERTEQLATTNEELTATNDELYIQKKELTATLEKLTSTHERLVQSEKMASLGVLAAGIAHEINNPLNFISSGLYGFESYFEENNFASDESVKYYFSAMHEGVRRATNIVRSLNQYSRSNNYTFESCDICIILDNCETMLSSQFKDRIKIIKEYGPHCQIAGNEGRLHQAFLNILANAVQAIPGEGTIRISARKLDSSLIIAISDSGCGIPQEDINKVFDPFFTTKEPGQGTGLGLSISLNIIKEHGGLIGIDSVLGQGTTMTISFPI